MKYIVFIIGIEELNDTKKVDVDKGDMLDTNIYLTNALI